MLIKKISSLIIAAIVCLGLQAQTVKELQAKKQKALEELAVTGRLLNETRKDKQGTENKLNLLNRSISQSTEYIKTLNDEIQLLDMNIDSIRVAKGDAQQQLERLRCEYAQTSRALYANRKYFSPLIFVISAENFNQAYRRFRYLQQVAEHRKRQAREISSITENLLRQENALAENRRNKETAANTKALEQQRLEQQRRQQSSQLSLLKKKESQLKEKQKKQQAQADKLNNKIQEMIAAEIRRQEEAKKKQEKKSDGKKYEMSKEEKLVAGNFQANKGKLPRPVEKSFISGHFGVQPHPVLDKVTINNKGIYLQAPAGSDARAVFEGEVTQCFSVPGSNQSVIVKHGNYRTVYSNLTTLYVKTGDKVTTKQKIGKIFTDKENDNKTEIYFMLYKDTDIQNPEVWLAK